MDKQAARFSAAVNFSEGPGPALAGQALAQYITGHPESHLLAYVTTEVTQWLTRVLPDESDKYVVLAAMNPYLPPAMSGAGGAAVTLPRTPGHWQVFL